MAHGLVAIEHVTRKSLHCNLTAYPTQLFYWWSGGRGTGTSERQSVSLLRALGRLARGGPRAREKTLAAGAGDGSNALVADEVA